MTSLLQPVLRTYALALSLSLGPSIVPVLISILKRRAGSGILLKRVLSRELHVTGFAFAVTLAVGGGLAFRRVLDRLVSLSSLWKTFLANVLSSSCGILLLQSRQITRSDRPSPTLDLTLLLLVRAIDVFVQQFVFHVSIAASQPSTPYHVTSKYIVPDPSSIAERLTREQQKNIEEKRRSLRTRIDALIFWVCSSRIMWCFFYESHRLPPSYVKWISALAEVDGRLLSVLRLLRAKQWSYGSPSNASLLRSMASDLGLPPAWGDPSLVPPVGRSPTTNLTWKSLGVSNRNQIGGIPCELVHGGRGPSCVSNSAKRGFKAFLEAVIIYLPAHFLPILLTRPKLLLRSDRLISTLFSVLRSSSFLSMFVASYWYTVCFTRSLFLAKLFPTISHNFWDGAYGCILAGCLVCGSSIWIENGRRRGEMALYVLPKAIRASLPNRWLRSGNAGVVFAERITFVLSLASLLTAAVCRPNTLRGLSRWTLAFVMNGTNSGFWKRKRTIDTVASTPQHKLQNIDLD